MPNPRHSRSTGELWSSIYKPTGMSCCETGPATGQVETVFPVIAHTICTSFRSFSPTKELLSAHSKLFVAGTNTHSGCWNPEQLPVRRHARNLSGQHSAESQTSGLKRVGQFSKVSFPRSKVEKLHTSYWWRKPQQLAQPQWQHPWQDGRLTSGYFSPSIALE